MTKAEYLTIILPLPVKVLSPNCAVATPGGRFAKAAAIKKYRRQAREAVEAEQIETAPWAEVKVDVAFHFPDRRRRDQDNAAASLKAVYDGVVDAGLVMDDDYKHMKRRAPVFLVDYDYPRVELTIARIK